MTNLDSILKTKDTTLLTKAHLVKALVFPVVMYGCESWTKKKTEHWRIDAFEFLVLEKTWESPGQQGDQTSQFLRKSTLNIHWKDCCWSWSSNIWPSNAKSQLVRKDSDAGKDWRQQEKEKQRVKWLNSIIASMDMNLSKLWEIMEDGRAWHTTLHGVSRGQTWLSNWTTTVTHVKKPDDQPL